MLSSFKANKDTCKILQRKTIEAKTFFLKSVCCMCMPINEHV